MRDADAGRLEDGEAVGVFAVQRIDQSVERLAQLAQPLGLARPVIGGALGADGQRFAELLENVSLFRLRGMQFQAERTQPDAGKAPVHHFERRHFFRDEQHCLAFGQAVRDQVGDGLALAGAGRAFEHQVAAGIDRADRLELRRIGQERRQDVLRAVGGVEPVEFAGRAFAGKGLARLVDQVPDDAV